jgi:predicted nucleotidyltransferase component of viral defense system
MIPQAYITEWATQVPWQTNEQVEQDLVICRVLVEIFSDKWLASSLAFRGGTALHKLYLSPQLRYSEDIDLVQLQAEPIKETVSNLQKTLKFLGECTVKRNAINTTLRYRFDSEFPPYQKLRLKVETNCREHKSVLEHQVIPFSVDSPWFKGQCNINTFRLEELLGTKLRALYQRLKGRDLYDIYRALTLKPDLDKGAILKCYHLYMKDSLNESKAVPPSQKVYLRSVDAKIEDPEFLGDTTALLRPDEAYEPQKAYDLVRSELLTKIEETKI